MVKYILFDTETTGAADEDRVIQIGAIILEGKSVEVFDEMCLAPLPIKLEAMEIHNITNEMIKDKPRLSQTEAYQKILDNNNQNNYLIAHNIDFDLSMISKEGFVNQYTLIDTLRCSRHLFSDMPYHRLQYLRYALKLNEIEQAEADKLQIMIKAHDAIGDVLVMKLLMSKLVEIAKEQYKDENPMKVLAKLTHTPILIKEFKFGKYKGKNIIDVVRDDIGYIKWMMDNMDLDEDMKYTLDKHLKDIVI